jgi:hypothetical protein
MMAKVLVQELVSRQFTVKQLVLNGCLINVVLGFDGLCSRLQ